MPLPLNTDVESRRLLRDDVYTSILNAIVDGTLEAGEHLRDEDLISWLGVSRTPIRQALNRLEEVGLIEMVPGRYTRVAPFDEDNITQAIYATQVIHLFSVRKTAATLTNEQLTQLDDHIERARHAATGQDRLGQLNALGGFFRVFHLATGNDVLYQAVEKTNPILFRAFLPTEGVMSGNAITDALTAIADAARRQDAAGAVAGVRAMMPFWRDQFITTIRPRLLAER
ncbi:GntR family transcriptional regulator [Microbacterium hydrocarbonoxydans]|uniref:GntR family transcriptional regulator n=1 Tax=Microbacterium hydrocarbonoxydans TaxID=273678 RepID=UPI00203A692E|nr:GntR family transcriptional regulator [Microbacterium hydrocarbonoxydans]MCM3781280.1 GntR family transcriptional regulator [Microbacterium hydrocarbonoxydans]